MTEVKTVAAGGLRFGYVDAGSGPLALCLHGFPDSAYTWRHLLPALADAGYHAVAPFMRGYAPTDIPEDGAYQTGALAADAVALHEAFGGDGDAVLVGHDWGATAVYAALAHAPGRWRRAVTLAVPPVIAMISGFLGYAQLNLTAAIGYYRAMLDRARHVPAYAAEEAAARRVGERPILYLHGEADGCLGVNVTRDAARHLPPGSRAEVVSGAGHFLHLERPAEVNRLIADWLDRRRGPEG
jgi:pimeloyl-ACP methyl ester carboxylesterase